MVPLGTPAKGTFMEGEWRACCHLSVENSLPVSGGTRLALSSVTSGLLEGRGGLPMAMCTSARLSSGP